MTFAFLEVALGAAAGAGIALLHSLLLWRGLRRLPVGAGPVGLLAGAAVRIAAVAALVVLVSGGKADRLAGCLAGFAAARAVTSRVAAAYRST